LGAYSVPPNLAKFRGPTSKGWDGKGRERGNEKRERREEGEGDRREGRILP